MTIQFKNLVLNEADAISEYTVTGVGIPQFDLLTYGGPRRAAPRRSTLVTPFTVRGFEVVIMPNCILLGSHQSFNPGNLIRDWGPLFSNFSWIRESTALPPHPRYALDQSEAEDMEGVYSLGLGQVRDNSTMIDDILDDVITISARRLKKMAIHLLQDEVFNINAKLVLISSNRLRSLQVQRSLLMTAKPFEALLAEEVGGALDLEVDSAHFAMVHFLVEEPHCHQFSCDCLGLTGGSNGFVTV